MFISFFEVLKILCAIFNNYGQILTYCFKIHGYVPDIIRCRARSFVRQLEDFFATFINTKITITFIHSFTVTCINNFPPFLVLLIILTQSLVSLVCFKITRMRFLGTFQFLLIIDIPSDLTFLLTYFLWMVPDLMLLSRNITWLLL